MVGQHSANVKVNVEGVKDGMKDGKMEFLYCSSWSTVIISIIGLNHCLCIILQTWPNTDNLAITASWGSKPNLPHCLKC